MTKNSLKNDRTQYVLWFEYDCTEIIHILTEHATLFLCPIQNLFFYKKNLNYFILIIGNTRATHMSRASITKSGKSFTQKLNYYFTPTLNQNILKHLINEIVKNLFEQLNIS